MTVTQTGRFLSFEILPAYKNNRKLQKPDRLSKADVRLTHKQASIVTTRLSHIFYVVFTSNLEAVYRR